MEGGEGHENKWVPDKVTGPVQLEHGGSREDEGRIFMGNKTRKKGCWRVFIAKQMSFTLLL